MRSTEAKSMLALLSGYWPTPALTEDEARVWMMTLTASTVSKEEARSVIVGCANHGDKWRPRAGEFVAMVQSRRRQRDLRESRPTLPSGEKFAGKNAQLEALADCRRMIGRSANRSRHSVAEAQRPRDEEDQPADLEPMSSPETESVRSALVGFRVGRMVP
jgi:hypothetical protein